MTIQLFYTSGTWQAPTGVTSVEVECWGGGGGTSQPSNNNARGGGGGGAYSKSTFSVTPGSNYGYVVGAAGGTDGSGGGDSYWVNTSTLLAKGGSGCTSDTGGTGGQASSGVGAIKYSGGNGANKVSTTIGGGGGSAAGSSGNGNAATGATGGTGVSEYGGAGGDGSNGTGVGGTGGLYGGGAGGSRRSGSILGAPGAPGLIRITFIEPLFVEKALAGAALLTASLRKPVTKFLADIVKSAAYTIHQINRVFSALSGSVGASLSQFDGYILQRKDGAGAYVDRARITKSTTEFTDCENLIGDVLYCYRIKRIRFGLESEWSNEQCILFSASTQHLKGVTSGIFISLEFDKTISKTSAAGVRITGAQVKQVKPVKKSNLNSSASIRHFMGVARQVGIRLTTTIQKPVNKSLTEIVKVAGLSRRLASRVFIDFAKASATTVKRSTQVLIKTTRMSPFVMKRAIKGLAKTLSASVTALRLNSLSKIIISTAKASASDLRHISRLLTEPIKVSGSVLAHIVRILSRSAQASGTLLKHSIQTLSNSITASGVIERIKVYLKTVSNIVRNSASFLKFTDKNLNSTVNHFIQILERTSRTVITSIKIQTFNSKMMINRLSDQISTHASALRTKIAYKIVSAFARPSTSIKRNISKMAGVGLNQTAIARKRTTKFFADRLSAMHLISKRAMVSLFRTARVIGFRTKDTSRMFSSFININATSIKQAFRYFNTSIHLIRLIDKANAFSKALLSVLSAAGLVTKKNFKTVVRDLIATGIWMRANLYFLALTTSAFLTGSLSRVRNFIKFIASAVNALSIGRKTRAHLSIKERSHDLETLERKLILEIEGVNIMAYIGDTIRLIGHFHDFSGALADVSGETITIYDGKKNVLVTAAPVHQATGIYTYDFTIPDCVSDPVVYEFSGTLEGSVILARSTIKRRWV